MVAKFDLIAGEVVGPENMAIRPVPVDLAPGSAAEAAGLRDGDEIMLMAAKGKLLRCKVDDIREVGRNTQGVRVLDLDGDDDRVIGVARLAEAAEAASEDQPEA